MMRLFIEPTEPLLFRTGRPFDAGENNFAETLFPPTPETLQGAIRATIAAYWEPAKTMAEVFQQKKLTDRIGNRTSYGRFRITAIALGRRLRAHQIGSNIERLFPMPAHILQEEEGENRQARLLPKLPKEKGVYTNLPDDKHLLYPDPELEGKLDTTKRWLTESGLRKALSPEQDLAKDDIIKGSDIYTLEPRMGIGMNNTAKTTEEGLLYQVQMIRMNHKMDPPNQSNLNLERDKDHTSDFSSRYHKLQTGLTTPYIYGFVIDVSLTQLSASGITYPEELVDDNQTQSLLHLPDQGWMVLGGERRAARFEVVKPSAYTQHQPVEQLQRGNLLYLATPAAFARGWQPKTWTYWPEPVAAAIDRYQPIGGWLLAPGSSGGGEQKPMRRCIPAGSVYFFNTSVNASRPFTDYGTEIGYGITYAGEW